MALYLRHPSSFEHDTGGHPENAGRLRAIEAALDERDWLDFEVIEAPAADIAELTRVHDAAHVESIADLSGRGGGMIDMDTVASAGSYEAALHSAGGARQAVDSMLGGDESLAFCGLRPPGHHAERERAMGFCLLNNVAVASAQAVAEHGAERVLVLDWDVHHGNGTEAIFASSNEVLYASIHQSPLYPGTGDASYVGVGDGEGFTVNMPVPPGTDGEQFLSLVQHVVSPIGREWRPGLIAISAGYDAHAEDPLAECRLDDADYGQMAASIGTLAAELGAPVLVCLEGGYAQQALARSVVATLEALGGEAEPAQAPADFAAPYRERAAKYWPSLAAPDA